MISLMKHTYLKWLMPLLMSITAFVQSSAQIVLHDATGITQTKATLSADFTDTGTEHGFQYKYGALPEIDEFSKVALSSLSDPVALVSDGNYAWSARKAKGWVESNPNVPTNQSSSMVSTIEVFDEETTLSFEWSVDSEEGMGILSFLIDDNEISQISGLVDFVGVSYTIPKGIHTLEWRYLKKGVANTGLNLGMVRNITILDTTPLQWQSVASQHGEPATISDLVPYTQYLYRAYNGSQISKMASFCTKDAIIKNITASDITQTTASIDMDTECGDAKYVYKLASCEYTPELEALLSPESEVPTVENPDGWFADNGQLTGKTGWSSDLILKFTLTEAAELSFDCYIEGGYIRSSISGNTTYRKSSLTVLGKTYEPKFLSRPTNHLEGATFTNQRFQLAAGYHEIKFHLYHNGSAGYSSTAKVWNLKINGLKPDNAQSIQSLPVRMTDLLPNHTYKVRGIISDDGSKADENSSWSRYSTMLTFKTLPVLVSLDTCGITQTTATLQGTITRGDAATNEIGIQYRAINGSWTTVELNNSISNIGYEINRLRPNESYECRAFAIPVNCDTVYSEMLQFNTKSVTTSVPTIIKLSQHEAILQGQLNIGDAKIYQRGMQFRKKNELNWEDVEDDGNDAVYTLVRKDLEMGVTYQARAYVQPAGCDVIYSDILEFTTLDNYFTRCSADNSTQTTISLTADLTDVDDGLAVEYGFEYFIYNDGFFENADTFEKSDVFDIPVAPNGKEIKTVITGLTPQIGIKWRAYAKTDGIKTYFSGLKNQEWNFAGTERALIKVSAKKITQTSISLELDATQNGDAVVTQIEYALAKQPYSICGNTITLNDLDAGKEYIFMFRGIVNGRYCPLLKEIEWDYSWFEYKTLPVAIEVEHDGITQTKAKVKISVVSGDADVTDIRYRLNDENIVAYSGEQMLTDLTPGKTYRITVYAKVNGEESSWVENIYGIPYGFKTKAVSSDVSIEETYQTAAKISWDTNYGDATFIGSGLEIGSEITTSEHDCGETTINELSPATSYSCRSYVETKEGGRVYSSPQTFTTSAITAETFDVTNISNRSATMNGGIGCDSYSSAEFGFQWKQIEGWQTAPAFTKGVKREDGMISVSLVNGMLEPNTEYMCRTAVRYRGEIYPADDWKTFRTESEYIYYPATVYTVYRTDRENNALILCGYYVAGSEVIVGQGYEYWTTGRETSRMQYQENVIVVNTDESMQHTFTDGELHEGNYAVRAFVKTESGETLYGATLGFSVTDNGYTGMESAGTDDVRVYADGESMNVVNGEGLSCYIYDVSGIIVSEHRNMSDHEAFNLSAGSIYIVKFSNGKVLKIRI